MTAIPPALAPWGPELSLLGDAARALIGPWLPKLERGVGRAPRGEASPEGALDGVDGIGRRGRFERLLVSEWAIAELAPDEFVRRAAAAEQSFLQLARRRPLASRRVLVFFDGGPEQAGAPRLAHLALLLVLAARARRRGAELTWGVLPGAPSAGFAVEQLRVFSRPAAARAPRPEEAAEVFAPYAGLEGEVEPWWIGGRAFEGARAAHGGRWLEPRPTLELGTAHLEIHAHGPRAPAAVSLVLPPPAQGLEALRAPGGRRSSPAASARRPGVLLPAALDPRGTTLLVHRPRGWGLRRIAPRGSRASAERIVDLSGEPVAFGSRGRETRFLLRRGGARYQLAWTNRGRMTALVEVRAGDEPVLAGADRALPGLIDTGRARPHRLGFVDAAHCLFSLAEQSGDYRLTLIASEVLIAGRAPRALWYVRRLQDELRIWAGGRERPLTGVGGEAELRPVAVSPEVARSEPAELFLVGERGSWRPFLGRWCEPILELEPSEEVVGGLLYRGPPARTRAVGSVLLRVISMSADRQRLRIHEGDTTRDGPRFASPLRRVTMAAERWPRLLLEHEDGSLAVWSLPDEKFLHEESS